MKDEDTYWWNNWDKLLVAATALLYDASNGNTRINTPREQNIIQCINTKALVGIALSVVRIADALDRGFPAPSSTKGKDQ